MGAVIRCRRVTLKFALAASAAFAMLLSGCASAGPSQAPPTESVAEGDAAEAPAATPTPTASSGPLTLPNCEQMRPDAYALAQEWISEYPYAVDGVEEVGLEHFNSITGPQAQSTMDSASQVRGCSYPVGLEFITYQWIAEITPEEQAPLIDALRADSSITEYSSQDAVGFEYDVPTTGNVDYISVAFVFVNNVWITVFDGIVGGTLTDVVITDLLKPLQDLNPDAHLGAADSDATEADARGGDNCSDMTAAEALSEYGTQLDSYEVSDWSIDDEYTIAAAEETFDPCAALSSITVGIEFATGSSPVHIMLFHYDEYLGTATADPKGFWPATVRLSDDAIEVTYIYTNPGEATVEASGRAVSVFTWNESTQSVDHSGEFPPGA